MVLKQEDNKQEIISFSLAQGFNSHMYIFKQIKFTELPENEIKNDVFGGDGSTHIKQFL
jgi:hypothetical protein